MTKYYFWTSNKNIHEFSLFFSVPCDVLLLSPPVPFVVVFFLFYRKAAAMQLRA